MNKEKKIERFDMLGLFGLDATFKNIVYLLVLIVVLCLCSMIVMKGHLRNSFSSYYY